ncbi:MAG: 2-oxoacid:acceptor oxidoreductase family protein [Eubacteriales bacterium]|nr:2-oxoacid:acceptor oxidoreductase family protein [Eubacteriales bacterium]
MTREIIIAGFGGQGVMSIGKTLTEAGLKEGHEVSWVPSYGPEMRGGTANCAVVISDEPIGSPVVNRPTELIAMNGPSLAKFEPNVLPGGLILVNASQVEQKVSRQDVKAYYIPSMEEAGKLGNFKVANMVMLGAYIKATGALKMDTIAQMLSHIFTGPKAHLVALNIKALEAGAAYIK